jgi:hypothetical protein
MSATAARVFLRHPHLNATLYGTCLPIWRLFLIVGGLCSKFALRKFQKKHSDDRRRREDRLNKTALHLLE